ncbi:MAG: ShlB/FhaC/HecB family hemolysin secretion/activation protein [Marinobacter sp.]|uniref:ShlB/FhaC/HecB family hemolysin secretion/activation protein n=1 Tax=Marinobacter sp. TaxID=50741 RepID=UPI00299D19EF|nr:ShlB/FhaC/HecB family hemolysin secretion/activation protein [Marinobacter sp.]MDX1635629.1 ShlB/FhaC/HecB family hemolysin secretion/activation protein [Marinobacter sp.]
MLFRPVLITVSLLMASFGVQAHWADAIDPAIEAFSPQADATGADLPAPDATDRSLVLTPVYRNWLGERVSVAGDSNHQDTQFRGNLGVAANDLTGLNDALSLNYQRSVLAREGVLNRGLGFNYAFPSRAGTIRVNGSLYEYEDSVTSADRRYDVRGDSQSVNVSANRTLFDRGGTELAATMGVGAREARKQVEDDRADTSQSRFSSLRVETRLRQTLALDAVAITRLTAEQGQEVFREASAGQWSETARHAYHKYSIQGTLSKPLWRWQCELNGRYQVAPDSLPGSHYLVAVSPAMMHGFGGQSLSGSRGGWLRLDASSPWQPLPVGPGLNTSLRFSILRGWVPQTRSEQLRYGSASAAEVALNVRGGGFQAGLRVGSMLSASARAAERPESPDLTLSFSVQL